MSFLRNEIRNINFLFDRCSASLVIFITVLGVLWLKNSIVLLGKNNLLGWETAMGIFIGIMVISLVYSFLIAVLLLRISISLLLTSAMVIFTLVLFLYYHWDSGKETILSLPFIIAIFFSFGHGIGRLTRRFFTYLETTRWSPRIHALKVLSYSLLSLFIVLALLATFIL